MGLRPYQEVAKEWKNVQAVWEYRNGDLYWLINAGRGVSIKRPGDKVSVKPDEHGYLYVTWKRKHYAVHRVIFLLMHGWLPDCIDHIDGNPGNNAIENLRAATRLQNQHNRRVNSKNESGAKNVTRHQGKWCVRFSVSGRTKHFGCFDTLEKAKEIAAKVRESLHGNFARHG
jgi:hypothetical protein